MTGWVSRFQQVENDTVSGEGELKQCRHHLKRSTELCARLTQNSDIHTRFISVGFANFFCLQISPV